MAEPGEVQESEVGAEESAGETEPEGPDLSSLDSNARAVLDSALKILEPYEPQPGTLSDLPQISVNRRHIVDVCRTVKDDDRIGAKDASLPGRSRLLSLLRICRSRKRPSGSLRRRRPP